MNLQTIQFRALPSVIERRSGNWLAAVRDFIQRRFVNGDSIGWGKHEELRGPTLTDNLLVEVAAVAVAAEMNEYISSLRAHLVLNNNLRRDNAKISDEQIAHVIAMVDMHFINRYRMEHSATMTARTSGTQEN